MNTKRQNRIRLSLEQMKTVCEAAEKDWSQGVVEAFRCFGVDLASDDCPQISPSDYAIPEEQWKTIAEACLRAPGNEVGKVNHMFDWMNYGPSGYEGLPVGTTCGLHGLPTDTGYCAACDKMNEGVPKEWTRVSGLKVTLTPHTPATFNPATGVLTQQTGYTIDMIRVPRGARLQIQNLHGRTYARFRSTSATVLEINYDQQDFPTMSNDLVRWWLPREQRGARPERE